MKNHSWVMFGAIIAVLALMIGVGVTGALFNDTETGVDNIIRITANTWYYLHNNPTPPADNTNSQTVLPMDMNAPTATNLYNYDQNRDSAAGLIILRGGSGATESDPSKYQSWQTDNLSNSLPLVGTVTVELWSAIKDFGQGKAGVVIVYLRDYNGSSYTEIANGTLSQADWQGGSSTWIKKTITISDIDYTVASGNQLEIKVIVDSSAGDDMWFTYDTTTYASVVLMPNQ